MELKKALTSVGAAVALALGSVVVAAPAEAGQKTWTGTWGSYSDCQWGTTAKLRELRKVDRHPYTLKRCIWIDNKYYKKKWVTHINYVTIRS